VGLQVKEDDGVIEVILNNLTERVGSDGDTLGRRSELSPLTPASNVVRHLERQLRVDAPLLPLVVETEESGTFRACRARWVFEGGESEPVETLAELDSLLQEWDGKTPDRDSLQTAQTAARQEAHNAVVLAAERADERERKARAAQLSAARGRLLREVARYLCARNNSDGPPGSGMLNQWFHAELARPGRGATRFEVAFERLGGEYPDWDASVVGPIHAEVAALNTPRRQNVLSATMLDAALADPRWVALGSITTPVSNEPSL
jgi:hypothetical protein